MMSIAWLRTGWLQIAILLGGLILPLGGLSKEAFSHEVLPRDEAEILRLGDHPLDRVAHVESAWNKGQWEEALKRFLELPEELRYAASYWVELDGIEVGDSLFEPIRDRAWRHLRDRLAAIDRPGNSSALDAFFPQVDRLILICTVTGMPLPHQAHEIRSRWKRRIEIRKIVDEWFWNLEDAFVNNDEKRVGDLLRKRTALPWLEESIDQQISHLLSKSHDRLHAMIQEARWLGQAGRVLDVCQRLSFLGIKTNDSAEASEWALKELKKQAKHNLDMKRDCQALLQMSRLAVEDELLPADLESLRQQLSRPLYPQILLKGQQPNWGESQRHYLIPGVVTVSQENLVSSVDPSGAFEPVGRFWSRSPGHLADAKRWVDLVDGILGLRLRWLDSPPSEAGLIRDRIDFHVTEALRLAERLESHPARRSRLVWDQISKESLQKSVRVILHCPITIFTHTGREITTALELTEILKPQVIEGIQLPVSRFQMERVERQLLAQLPGEIERLAHRWASDRLEKTLSTARSLARGGAPNSALELLLPALLGAGEPGNRLIEQASADLAHWSGLGGPAVHMALGRSQTP